MLPGRLAHEEALQRPALLGGGDGDRGGQRDGPGFQAADGLRAESGLIHRVEQHPAHPAGAFGTESREAHIHIDLAGRARSQGEGPEADGAATQEREQLPAVARPHGVAAGSLPRGSMAAMIQREGTSASNWFFRS